MTSRILPERMAGTFEMNPMPMPFTVRIRFSSTGFESAMTVSSLGSRWSPRNASVSSFIVTSEALPEYALQYSSTRSPSVTMAVQYCSRSFLPSFALPPYTGTAVPSPESSGGTAWTV